MKKLSWMFVAISFILVSVVHAKTEISFYLPSGATTESSRLYYQQIRGFLEKNRDMGVRFYPKSNYNEVLFELLTLNRAGKGWVGIVEISELMTLKDKGAIAPIDEMLGTENGGSKKYLSRFIPGFLGNSYGDDGKCYALPIFRSTPIIYYNLEILAKAGVDVNNLPKTWDELEIVLQKVKANTGAVPLGLAPTWYGWIFEAFVRQNKGALANKSNTQVLFDKKPVISALGFWKKLYDAQLMERVQGSWKSTINGFVHSQIFATVYYSSGGMSFVEENAKFKWATTIMPGNPSFGTSVGGGNLFFSSKLTDAEKNAAWRLANFLLRAENQAMLSSRTGYFPAVKKAFDDPLIAYKYSKNKNFHQAKEQLDFAKPKIMTRNYSDIRVVLKRAIDDTLDRDIAPEESLKQAQKDAQKILKKKK